VLEAGGDVVATGKDRLGELSTGQGLEGEPEEKEVDRTSGGRGAGSDGAPLMKAVGIGAVKGDGDAIAAKCTHRASLSLAERSRSQCIGFSVHFRPRCPGACLDPLIAGC
jgi:hypothetical protein